MEFTDQYVSAEHNWNGLFKKINVSNIEAEKDAANLGKLRKTHEKWKFWIKKNHWEILGK